MRIDKFLKVSRLIKRRTVAAEACDAGRISVNGKSVKPGYDVKLGDVVEIRFGEKSLKVEIMEIKETVGKNDAAATGTHSRSSQGLNFPAGVGRLRSQRRPMLRSVTASTARASIMTVPTTPAETPMTSV